MSAQLRNLMGAGFVAVGMLFPIAGDDPSAAARALLGQVGTIAQAGPTSNVADPLHPRAEQALLGRIGGQPSGVSTGSKSITGEQAILAHGF